MNKNLIEAINRITKYSCLVFLNNGVKLTGAVTHKELDCETPFLIIRKDGNEQIVFVHAIATILEVK